MVTNANIGIDWPYGKHDDSHSFFLEHAIASVSNVEPSDLTLPSQFASASTLVGDHLDNDQDCLPSAGTGAATTKPIIVKRKIAAILNCMLVKIIV